MSPSTLIRLTSLETDCRRSGGAEAVKDLPKILSHPVFEKHITVAGDFSTVLEAPTVQVTVLYFPSNISASEKEKVETAAKELIRKRMNASQDVQAVKLGWSVENNFPMLQPGATVDQSGIALSLFVGWTSVKAREEFVRDFDLVSELKRDGKSDSLIGEVTRLIECRKFGSSRQ